MRLNTNPSCEFWAWDYEDCILKITTCENCKHYLETGTKSAEELEEIKRKILKFF